MSKQYYVREGRRFVKTDVPSVVDHRGEYYNADGSFSKEKRNDSVGVCIMQNPTECIICGLAEYKNVTYNGVSCLLHNFPNWRLGEQEEMRIAIELYREKLNLKRGKYYHMSISGAGGGMCCLADYCDMFFAYVCDYTPGLLRLFKTVKL